MHRNDTKSVEKIHKCVDLNYTKVYYSIRRTEQQSFKNRKEDGRLIELITKLSVIAASWLTILKLALELRKMRKETKSKKRRSPPRRNVASNQDGAKAPAVQSIIPHMKRLIQSKFS